MKKPLIFILNGFTIVAMLFAASQLMETHVKAEDEAGTCCWYSDGCPGTDTCWYPRSGQTECCNPELSDVCHGPNYCGQKGPPGGN
jgi:hypothetical protein